MATMQSSTSSDQGGTAPPPGIDAETWAKIQAAIGQPNASSSVQSPIGVPYYVTDPNTGQPLLGPNNQPIRWGASVPVEIGPRGNVPMGGPGSAPSSGSQYVLPRYFQGDEWLPASLPPEQVAALQRKLVAAGLLKPGDAQLGVWDLNSVQAYQRLLAYANGAGLDAQNALDRWDAAHAADPNAGKAPLTKQVTSLDDLRPAIRKAFIDTLGYGISQEEVDHLATQFQSMQGGAQQQAYNMQDTGGTVTAPPSAQDFAAAQATQRDPLGAQEHTLIGAGGPLDSFRAMLNGWAA